MEASVAEIQSPSKESGPIALARVGLICSWLDPCVNSWSGTGSGRASAPGGGAISCA